MASPRDTGETPRVAFEVDAPTRAVLRDPTEIVVRARNLGQVPVQDLGVKINRGYANVFTVTQTRPPSQIDDASTEKRLYFGQLPIGSSQTYRIALSPQRVGEFNLAVRFVAARRGLEPLPLSDAATGKTEFAATTTVVGR